MGLSHTIDYFLLNHNASKYYIFHLSRNYNFLQPKDTKALFNHEEHEGHEGLVYSNLRALRVLRGSLCFRGKVIIL